jgi:hypothetical protein
MIRCDREASRKVLEGRAVWIETSDGCIIAHLGNGVDRVVRSLRDAIDLAAGIKPQCFDIADETVTLTERP